MFVTEKAMAYRLHGAGREPEDFASLEAVAISAIGEIRAAGRRAATDVHWARTVVLVDPEGGIVDPREIWAAISRLEPCRWTRRQGRIRTGWSSDSWPRTVAEVAFSQGWDAEMAEIGWNYRRTGRVRSLPNYWDEVRRRHPGGWKTYRKTQWRTK